MVAFRSGRRPSGESLKKINESRKSKIETIQSKTKIIKGRKLIEKKAGGVIDMTRMKYLKGGRV